MLSREICGRCYEKYVGYGQPRVYEGQINWLCPAKPYENSHHICVDDPIPERCPFKFEQGVFAGMTDVK